MFWELSAANAATDLSGNSRDGTGAGSITIGGATGLLGAADATAFDDTDDRITSSYASFVVGSTRTFCGWAYRDDSADADVLFSSSLNAGPRLQLNSASQDVNFDPDVVAGGAATTWTAAWPGNAVWVFWTLVFDDTANTASLYINGALVTTESQTEAYNAAAGNYQVGGRGPTGTNPFDGKQTRVAVYEYALTAAQVRYLYQNTPVPDESYRTIAFATSGIGPDAATAGYLLGSGQAATHAWVSGAGESVADRPPYVFRLAAADYLRHGKTTVLRMRTEVLSNATAPGTITYATGLYPATVAGVADVVNITAGTLVTGSQASVVNPTASTVNPGLGTDFTFPADGAYLFGTTSSATQANNNAVVVSAHLQLRHI